MMQATTTAWLTILALSAGTVGAGLWCDGHDAPQSAGPGDESAQHAPVVELDADASSPESPAAVPRDIDLALCLDTSGSMSGLIDSAKQRLWALVNDMALAEPTPRLRVALLTYGSPAYGADNGWVQTSVPLTDDLDMVSMKLFELSTDGGDEYVARVTQAATSQLQWSTDPAALKMIVVAGNESAEQDSEVTLEVACGSAIEQGIVVHSLYCAQGGAGRQQVASGRGVVPLSSSAVPVASSNASTTSTTPGATAAATPTPLPLDGIAMSWKKVSLLADGAFAMINQDTGVVLIETPFDEKLVKLSSALNETYIPYGSGAQWYLSNQFTQDVNAFALNTEAAASRAQAKAGKLYFCGWDLVDSLKAKQLTFEGIETDQLPEALRALSTEELRLHVEAQREARAKIQADIAAAGAEREAWLVAKRTELGTDESMAFDSPLRRAFRELAEARGLRFAEPTQPALADQPRAEPDGASETGS